ncbi:uncharacterized protein [Temnothorax nylanderi]|uniref:uncharacterized protein isoform X2 n=1 Tax=Temnothorax nylanderi TaxID=102681 RepID=UPI003A8C2043
MENYKINACSENLIPLKLMDAATNKLYTLYLSPHTHHRAMKDTDFSTKLLEKHKKTVNNSLKQILPIYQNENSQKHPSTDSQESCSNASVSSDFSTDYGNEECVNENEFDENDGSTLNTLKNKDNNRHLWTKNETLLLLSLYKEYEEALSRGKLTYRKVFNNIGKSMNSKGYGVTAAQCSSKIDTLKRVYKSVKDHNAQSGNSPKTCDFYEQLDDLFCNKPWINPISTAGSNLPLDKFNEKDESSICKRPKLVGMLESEKIEYLKQSLEDKRLKREATEKYREKKLAIMEKLLQYQSK